MSASRQRTSIRRVHVLTFASRQSSPQQFYWDQIIQYTLLVRHRRTMTVAKGIIKILFRQIVLILEHVQSTDIISIGDHFSLGSTLVYASAFHWSENDVHIHKNERNMSIDNMIMKPIGNSNSRHRKALT